MGKQAGNRGRSWDGAQRASAAAERELTGPPEASPRLQLAMTAEGLGLELAEPLELPWGHVTELTSHLPHLQFPVDLSGGVTRFRHRISQLKRLGVRLGLANLEAWFRREFAYLGPVFGVAQGKFQPFVCVLPHSEGMELGCSWEGGAFAINVLWSPSDEGAELLLAAPRGLGLATSPWSTALQLTDGLIGGWGERKGSRVLLPRLARRLSQEVLHRAGARAPRCPGLRWSSLEWHARGAELVARQGEAARPASRLLTLAREGARIAEDGDDLLGQNRRPDARRAYLAALERAPLHPGIAHRLAQLDSETGEHDEAALSHLVASQSIMDAGVVAAELLLSVGDQAAAVAAFERAAQLENFGPLASMALHRAAQACEGPAERFRLLEEAIIRSPQGVDARWLLFEEALRLHAYSDARAQAQALDRQCPVGHKRSHLALRIGHGFLAEGLHGDAREWFERCLRYEPGTSEATLGLARALGALGDGGRAVQLLARACDAGLAGPEHSLLLGEILGRQLGHFPTALGRLADIPAGSDVYPKACFLKGQYLAQLGDRAGASLAYQAMHSTLLRKRTSHQQAHQEEAQWLWQAAQFEELQNRSLSLAKHHLGLGLRLAPSDKELEAEFRRVAEAYAERQELQEPLPRPGFAPGPIPSSPLSPSASAEPSIQQRSAPSALADAPDAAPAAASKWAERAELLQAQVRANPEDIDAVEELAQLLLALERPLDAFALLQAQQEDGDPECRQRLLPLRQQVLEVLQQEAMAGGREMEAELYGQMLKELLSPSPPQPLPTEPSETPRAKPAARPHLGPGERRRSTLGRSGGPEAASIPPR